MSGDLEMAYPQAGYWIVMVVPFVLMGWRLMVYRQRMVRRYADGQSLKKMVVGRKRLREGATILLICLAWVAATVALAQPRGNARLPQEQGSEKIVREEISEKGDPMEVTRRLKGHDLLFLLDVSASMSVTDTRTGITRLALAKEIIDEIASRLHGHTAALYAFTSELTTVVPPTMDYLYLRLMLRHVKINEGDVAGTDLFEAIEGVWRRQLQGRKKRLKTVVLLTDGGDTGIEMVEGEERQREVDTLVARVGDAKEQNLRFITVGLGSKKGELIPGVIFEGEPVHSTLDEELLVALSSRGRGKYYYANDYSTLAIAEDVTTVMNSDDPYEEEEVVQLATAKVKRTIEEENKPEPLYDLFFQLPLALAILMLMGEMLWIKD